MEPLSYEDKKSEIWSTHPKRIITWYGRFEWLNEKYYKKIWIFLVKMTIYHAFVILYST